MSPYVPGAAYRIGSIERIGPVQPVRPVSQPPIRPDEYPPVNPSLFVTSASNSHQLAQQAAKVLERIRQSKELAGNIMDAAQRGNETEVIRLIRGAGASSVLAVKISPDGIQLIFRTEEASESCCELVVKMRWN
ncbi:hypothetical protein [Paenibacillus apiarius]|uniref:Uncharacterized protein n=1 Tax=Paenibacillus apiarius TaxID=46240 RepID=A0ABT4DMA3_9BACL|nr:hypothetical protein [Paenibacillus apiarius]MBN3526308.1 hypothetical protein [Paenibacillus apiarius]MCY9516057.1 hypothetical protein [Paenibacillus apiarius]MCY9518484.1 hypothetical protein [Paenibacillus apiarius]MCY9551115.1 hypothetical protein [Paenibacillus apiarius]MCY9558269.1 hypothetical protein [Paenibacillus apiarius]